MAQKVNPISLRLGHNRTQDAHWFSMYNYGKCVGQSIVLRKHFKTILKQAKLVHARTALLKTQQAWKVVPVFGRDDSTARAYTNVNSSPTVNKLSLAQKTNPLGSTLFQSQKSKLGIALTLWEHGCLITVLKLIISCLKVLLKLMKLSLLICFSLV